MFCYSISTSDYSGENSPNPSPNLSYRATGYAPSIWLAFDEFLLRESNTWFLQVPLIVIKTTLSLLAICWMIQSFGQQQTAIFLDAASASGVQQMFYKTSIAKNASNDVFTCGATINGSGNYDILLTKHNSANVLQWSATFAGSYGGDDYAADIALDASGNVYVVGTTQVGPWITTL
jgi:hypothetical protein